MPDIIITHELPGVDELIEVTVDDTVGTDLICCGQSYCEGLRRHLSCGVPLVLKSVDIGAGEAVYECAEATCPDFGEEFLVAAEAV